MTCLKLRKKEKIAVGKTAVNTLETGVLARIGCISLLYSSRVDCMMNISNIQNRERETRHTGEGETTGSIRRRRKLVLLSIRMRIGPI